MKKTGGQKYRDTLPLTCSSGAQVGLIHEEEKKNAKKSCDTAPLTCITSRQCKLNNFFGVELLKSNITPDEQLCQFWVCEIRVKSYHTTVHTDNSVYNSL